MNNTVKQKISYREQNRSIYKNLTMTLYFLENNSSFVFLQEMELNFYYLEYQAFPEYLKFDE
jgi:hypothetical protein